MAIISSVNGEIAAMRLLSVFAASALLIVTGAHALAWNNRGHMMVAAVAWENLTPRTKARVAELLKLNPSYAQWVKGASEDDADEIAFVKAATWPDSIKSN